MHLIHDCALWISLCRTFSYFCSFSLFCYLLIFAYSEDQRTFLSNMSRPPVMQHHSWRIIIIWCTTQNIYDWIGFQIHALGFSKAYCYSKRFQIHRYVLVFWLLSDNHKKSLHYFKYFIKPSKQNLGKKEFFIHGSCGICFSIFKTLLLTAVSPRLRAVKA